jgi:hypothetical protein
LRPCIGPASRAAGGVFGTYLLFQGRPQPSNFLAQGVDIPMHFPAQSLFVFTDKNRGDARGYKRHHGVPSSTMNTAKFREAGVVVASRINPCNQLRLSYPIGSGPAHSSPKDET